MKMGLDVAHTKENFGHLTPLEIEMKICTEYLHCTHEEFNELPTMERLKLRLYMEKQGERQKYYELERKNKEAQLKVEGNR